MRKTALILLMSLTVCLLHGCFDASEIDDILQVSALGIDVGEKDDWRITIQFPTLREGGGNTGGGGGSSGGNGGGGGGGEGREKKEEDGLSQDGFTVVSCEAPSFYEALAILDASVPREINFMQTQVVVFSEDVAKGGKLGEFIAPLVRFREIRRTSFIFVTKGKAMDFIKANKPYIGTDISKNYRIWIEESRGTGYFPYVTIGSFYEKLKSPKSQAIATLAAVNDFSGFAGEGEQESSKGGQGSRHAAGKLPRISENKVELWGTAIFDGEIMAGELNGDETRYLLMLRNEFSRGIYTIQDPLEEGVIVVIELRSAKPADIKVEFVDDVPRIQTKIYLHGDILSIQGQGRYEQKEEKAILEEAVRQQLITEIRALIDKCVSLNVDAMMFGGIASREFLTIDEFEAYGWNDRFREAIVDIDIEFTIRRTGKLVRTGPVES